MEFLKLWFVAPDNKSACRFILVDAVNRETTKYYYERNGFLPLFSREQDEKTFYNVKTNEPLRTRMYYFDLLPKT